MKNAIWVFCAEGAVLPFACFSDRIKAEQWIERVKATGVLTKMPIDQSVFDWAIENDKFSPRGPHQTSPKYQSKFTSAALEHYHYQAGFN
jgi:hypothetical protein